MATNYNKLISNIYGAFDNELFFLTFNVQTLCGSMYIKLIKLIWMIVNKLYSDVSLFILTSYIMVLCHNFLYIFKDFFRSGTGSVYYHKLYKFIL